MVGKVTLHRYMRIKTLLRQEPFLKNNRVGVRRLVRLRAGVERLQVVRGRFRGVERSKRCCLVCGSGEVEDELHLRSVRCCVIRGESCGQILLGLQCMIV